MLLLELFHIRHQKSDRLAGRAVPGKGSTNAIMQRGEMASSWKCASGVSCVVKWLIISHLTANKDLCSIILFIDAANIFLIAIVTYLIFSVVGWLVGCIGNNVQCGFLDVRYLFNKFLFQSHYNVA